MSQETVVAREEADREKVRIPNKDIKGNEARDYIKRVRKFHKFLE